LQKKLEIHQRKLRDLEKYGVEQKSVREKVHGIRTVGGNIISKPKELAHKLRHKFGSADNLSHLSKEAIKDARNPHGSSSLPRDNPGKVKKKNLAHMGIDECCFISKGQEVDIMVESNNRRLKMKRLGLEVPTDQR